jgi:hypothetical protein
MQPRTPRSYALDVPTGDDPKKTLAARAGHARRPISPLLGERGQEQVLLPGRRNVCGLVADDVFEVQEGLRSARGWSRT